MKAAGAAEWASRPSPHNLFFLLVAIAMVCGASYASAVDFAILNNGFSIRHERREVVGSVTRLYLGADPDGYVDVPDQPH